jgi:hypothetical protein
MINENKITLLLTILFFLIFSNQQLMAYELLEMDGNDVAGDALVTKGWENDIISYMTITNNYPAGLTSVEWTDAVTDSFQSWTDITSSTIQLNYNGDILLTDVNDFSSYASFNYPETSAPSPAGTDGNRAVACVSEWISNDLPSDALAITFYILNTETRYIEVADILVNCDSDPASNFTWAIGAVPGAYDVQSVLTHEVGHFIGIGHPYDDNRNTSTMWFTINENDIEPQSLEEDDEYAAIYLYPANMTLVTTPLVVPPDNGIWGLRDTFTGEWTDNGPLNADNDPLVNGSGGGGGCSVSSQKVNASAFLLPYALLFFMVFLSRTGKSFSWNRKY